MQQSGHSCSVEFTTGEGGASKVRSACLFIIARCVSRGVVVTRKDAAIGGSLQPVDCLRIVTRACDPVLRTTLAGGVWQILASFRMEVCGRCECDSMTMWRGKVDGCDCVVVIVSDDTGTTC